MFELPKAFSVLGLPVHIMKNYPDWLLDCLREEKGTHVVTLNAEMTMQAERNPALSKVIQNAELVIPDGAGVVLYLQYLLGQDVQRFPGIELAENLLQVVSQQKKSASIFFYGGAPGVAAKAADLWQKQLPQLQILGTHSGYHFPEEEQQLLQTLTQLQPQVIFVGLGVPRQELWIAQNRHLCPHSIWVGVGGSFDIWSGTKTRAPGWLANNNLEWLYRLYQEPWRWRRMLALPEFALKSLVYRWTVRCE
ncbi:MULTISPECIES: WecB/TagA/CpsF family glycosyltransferase [unclassified Anabaena]|uniref:WecB/TagA/CpsF family glycosyltransferase n=1 Tax=unclassified Anabaena TaxID=2619674 RepID=UPI00144521A7|nr:MULTISPECIES: WecB/TagA/CpsF family glycosyltransferase [unclassified Anabaena]MTJ10265.1 WecB/TagA/CpsF family glycosyltransferase [Anabaena sp. UHCC 0204]MTJ51303.1 WecB/TagA/CpsF family glycosyltransferase [Anabaena sp. UHCC 0253]